MMFIHQVERSSSTLASRRITGSVPSGTAMSNDRPTSGPKNPFGVTPMIVNGARSIETVLPTTSGAPP